MRHMGSKNDKINAPIAGFVSAFSLAIDSKNRRALMTTLMMSRALEASINIGETSGAIPKLKHRDVLLWVIANVFLQSALGMN